MHGESNLLEATHDRENRKVQDSSRMKCCAPYIALLNVPNEAPMTSSAPGT